MLEIYLAPTQWPLQIQTGMLRHSLLIAIWPMKLPIGRGTKALNPGGVGAKPPQAFFADADCLLKQGALS